MICEICGSVREIAWASARLAAVTGEKYVRCPGCGSVLFARDLRGVLEFRYNHNHDSKGRFCSGGGSGADNGFIGSDEVEPAAGETGKILNALAIFGKSAIMDTGEHEMFPDSIAGVGRGAPMSFEQADSGRANPHYSTFMPDEYSVNCQSCVIAHEARIRGYDVQAKGFDPNNVLMNNLSHFSTKAWIDPKTGKAPKLTEYKGQSDKCGEWLDSTVKQGERYSVEYSHKHGFKHIVTASRDENGVIRIYDPQNNSILLGIDALNARFGSKNGKIHDIKILRVDNLDFNLTFANAVLRNKG